MPPSSRGGFRACLALALAAAAALRLTFGETPAHGQPRADDAGVEVGADASAGTRSTPARPAQPSPSPRRGSARERPPSVHARSFGVQGPLRSTTLDTALRRHFGQFRVCHETALRNNPNLAGRVAMVVAIGPDGSVTSAEIDGKRTTLCSDVAVTCLLDRLRALPFPPATRAAPTNARIDLRFGFD